MSCWRVVMPSLPYARSSLHLRMTGHAETHVSAKWPVSARHRVNVGDAWQALERSPVHAGAEHSYVFPVFFLRTSAGIVSPAWTCVDIHALVKMDIRTEAPLASLHLQMLHRGPTTRPLLPCLKASGATFSFVPTSLPDPFTRLRPTYLTFYRTYAVACHRTRLAFHHDSPGHKHLAFNGTDDHCCYCMSIGAMNVPGTTRASNITLRAAHDLPATGK